MTIEQLTLVSVGLLVNGLTFALGIVAGASMRRKETRHDDSNSYEERSRKWHTPGKN